MTTGLGLLCLAAAGALLACGGGDAPSTSPIGAGSALQSSGQSANPYGIPYPAPGAGYGHTPRSGSTPGSVLQNFKFEGYVGGVVPASGATSVVSLADYYDPCGRTYRLIHLTGATVWCGPCNQETDALVAGKDDMARRGVVVLQFLFEGPAQGTAATPSMLATWIHVHHTSFTEMLDPELGDPDLGGFFQQGIPPWNADIDPRTMELLTSAQGWSGSLDAELAQGLDDVAIAPAYPVTARCP